MIVAPHPDDEAIGAWGLIGALRRQRTRVHIIVVSDGGASHPGSRHWPRDRLVTERRCETIRAMRRLGVTRAAIRFLGRPDGALTIGGCHAALRRAVRPTPQLIVGPAPADAHADHRAVADALARLALPGTRRLAYPVWPAAACRGRASHLAIGTRATAKRRALRRYRTQAGLITDSPTGFAMSARQIAAFAAPRETFLELRR